MHHNINTYYWNNFSLILQANILAGLEEKSMKEIAIRGILRNMYASVMKKWKYKRWMNMSQSIVQFSMSDAQADNTHFDNIRFTPNRYNVY